MYILSYLILPTLSVVYFDQLLLAAHQVLVVYLAQLLSAALYIHFISNHNIYNFFQKVEYLDRDKKAYPQLRKMKVNSCSCSQFCQ